MLRCSEALGVLKCPQQGSDTAPCVFKGHSGIRETHLGMGAAKGKGGRKMPLALIQIKDGLADPSSPRKSHSIFWNHLAFPCLSPPSESVICAPCSFLQCLGGPQIFSLPEQCSVC